MMAACWTWADSVSVFSAINFLFLAIACWIIAAVFGLEAGAETAAGATGAEAWENEKDETGARAEAVGIENELTSSI